MEINFNLRKTYCVDYHHVTLKNSPPSAEGHDARYSNSFRSTSQIEPFTDAGPRDPFDQVIARTCVPLNPRYRRVLALHSYLSRKRSGATAPPSNHDALRDSGPGRCLLGAS